MSAAVTKAIDALSAASEELRQAGLRERRDDAVLGALVVAALVLALREGVDDVAQLRAVAIDVGAMKTRRT